MKPVRWGILGPGRIARRFAEGIRQTEESELYAVGSRDYAKSFAFMQEWGGKAAYGTYEELLEDPNVDLVYIAVIHPYHADLAKLALRHNKSIVVEKPFAINGKQTREILNLARERGLFVMEAMWTRFHLATQKVREWIEGGEIGQVCLAKAQFGYNGGEDRSSRHLNRELGGGALLDIGIYALSFAGLVLGYEPKGVLSASELDPITSVDRSFSAILDYGNAQALVSANVMCDYRNEAVVTGTKGTILVPPEFYHPHEVRLIRNDGREEVFHPEMNGNGFHFEAREAARCFREGLQESPWQTWAETQAWMDVMDRMRAEWGMTYPGETEAKETGKRV